MSTAFSALSTQAYRRGAWRKAARFHRQLWGDLHPTITLTPSCPGGPAGDWSRRERDEHFFCSTELLAKQRYGDMMQPGLLQQGAPRDPKARPSFS